MSLFGDNSGFGSNMGFGALGGFGSSAGYGSGNSYGSNTGYGTDGNAGFGQADATGGFGNINPAFMGGGQAGYGDLNSSLQNGFGSSSITESSINPRSILNPDRSGTYGNTGGVSTRDYGNGLGRDAMVEKHQGNTSNEIFNPKK